MKGCESAIRVCQQRLKRAVEELIKFNNGCRCETSVLFCHYFPPSIQLEKEINKSSGSYSGLNGGLQKKKTLLKEISFLEVEKKADL